MAGLPVSPVNAWSYASRRNPHDSGPKRIAISISYRTFIDYLLPVCPGASQTTVSCYSEAAAQGKKGSDPNGTDLSDFPRASAPNLLILINVLALLLRMAVFADARLGGRPRLGEQCKGFGSAFQGTRLDTPWS
jgi:hypothetical protein